MGCRGSEEYTFQTWFVALFSLLSVFVGLGQTAFGAWLIITSRSIAPLLGVAVVDAYTGYVAIAAFAVLTGVIGCIGSLLKRICLLIMYATMLGGSMVFLIAISVFIYIEQTKISTELEMRIVANPESSEAINFRFNCRLNDNGSDSGNRGTDDDLELSLCSDFVLRQLWVLVWAKLGLNGFHVCLQFLLIVMTIMLTQLLKGAALSLHSATVRVQPLPTHHRPRRDRLNLSDSLEEDTASSTVPTFCNSPPVTPGVHLPGSLTPSIPLTPSAPLLSPSAPVSPSHYNIDASCGGNRQRRHTLHYINRGAHSPSTPGPLSPGLGLPSNRSTTTNL